MHIEPLSTDLIERYLRLRNFRFFRDNDSEDFLLLFSSERCQVHVQITVTGRDRDVLAIRVNPADYYSAGDRGRLMELVNEWNRDTHWPKAFVRETANPSRVSVIGELAYPMTPGVHLEALTTFVDCAIGCSMDLFDKIAESLELPSAQTLETWLRPAS